MSRERHTPRRQVEAVVNSLTERFGAVFDLAAIAAEVECEFATYSNARITEFVPVIIERRVQRSLRSRLSSRPFTPEFDVGSADGNADSSESLRPTDYQEAST